MPARSAAVVAAAEPQEQLPARQPVEDGVGVVDDLPLGLPHQVPLQPVAAEQLRELRGVVQLLLQFQRLLPQPLAFLAVAVEDRLLLAGLLKVLVLRRDVLACRG